MTNNIELERIVQEAIGNLESMGKNSLAQKLEDLYTNINNTETSLLKMLEELEDRKSVLKSSLEGLENKENADFDKVFEEEFSSIEKEKGIISKFLNKVREAKDKFIGSCKTFVENVKEKGMEAINKLSDTMNDLKISLNLDAQVFWSSRAYAHEKKAEFYEDLGKNWNELKEATKKTFATVFNREYKASGKEENIFTSLAADEINAKEACRKMRELHKDNKEFFRCDTKDAKVSVKTLLEKASKKHSMAEMLSQVGEVAKANLGIKEKNNIDIAIQER